MNKNKSQDNNVMPLKSLREELGFTQSQLAHALGVSDMKISRSERGESEPVFTIKQIKTLCKLLGKSIEEMPDYLGKDYIDQSKN